MKLKEKKKRLLPTIAETISTVDRNGQNIYKFFSCMKPLIKLQIWHSQWQQTLNLIMPACIRAGKNELNALKHVEKDINSGQSLNWNYIRSGVKWDGSRSAWGG